jgi:type I restriction enzyme, R subunit
MPIRNAVPARFSHFTDPRHCNTEAVLSSFRNDYYPRIAVTVDMIATGTDVKPIECLIFMRDVRSKNYFEQMKGRGTRVLSRDELQKVHTLRHGE